jgi:peptide/nickel transport system substrate-binding protein
VFDTLAAWDVDGNAVPYLAESFTPNETFTAWQVKLRPGISFHDGTPLNADALLVNFETALEDPIVGLAVRPFFPDPGAGGVPIEKIDDLTIQLNLLEPNAFLPGALTGQLGFVASPTWLQDALADPALNQRPIGTGPFVFDRREEDSVTRFVRNDAYWNGEVYLDAIEFLPRTDPDVRADLLIEGEIEALHTSDPSAVQKLTAVDEIQNLLDETGEESFLMINSQNPPFDDVRAREALARATPRQNYQQLIALGQNRLADQRYIPESRFHDPDVRQVGDDPEGARALVEAYCADVPANCTDGAIDIEYQWAGPSVVGTRTADLFVQAWDGLFDVTRQELPQDDHILEAVTGQFDVVAWRQFGAVDPSGDNVWLLCRTTAGLALNFTRLCDEQRDALLLEGQATTDEARRIEIYQEVEQRINEDYVYVYLVHTTWDNAFAPEVRGVCDATSPEGVALRCSVNGRTLHQALWLAG